MSTITPSQTVGPFFAYGLTPKGNYAWNDIADNDLVTPELLDSRIEITGTLCDGDGAPISDGMVEIWQADGRGRFPSAKGADGGLSNSVFRGFGRCPTGPDGSFTFSTVKPGATEDSNGGRQAPHILIAVFARGLLTHVFTRLYFEDEPANAADPVLQCVPAERRATLIAKRHADGAGYRFDIHLQGDRETVFFDF
ncbi:MAG: protocatechuate 3,4-dioxygenase alpha subunit [Afipia broomeae]|jgi:protocatechuate 3,4-dioxygenase, alpha subunit|nr:MAG: protocatechuate 3,4-dioxygenase subunit alpha [Bradyrhizobiaceae bacterium]